MGPMDGDERNRDEPPGVKDSADAAAPAPRVADVETIRAALRRVVDPEAGVNIVDLGLVYRIEAGPDRVVVEMTMTSPACPMGSRCARASTVR